MWKVASEREGNILPRAEMRTFTKRQIHLRSLGKQAPGQETGGQGERKASVVSLEKLMETEKIPLECARR